jgi:glyoxylase-like metal-dependent hydrolase (beta-lactamase superfamily II)
MFLVYDRGVVVVDVPQTLVAFLPKAIAEVTDKPITHVVYSHSHADHIGGTKTLVVIRSSLRIRKLYDC